MEISTFFVNFGLNQIQNCSVEIQKMKDGIFIFQLKKILLLNVSRQCQKKNVPPPLDLTRILKLYHESNDRKKLSEKQEPPIPCEINHAILLVKNGKVLFNKLTWKISQLTQDEQASRKQESKQVDFSLQTNTSFSFGQSFNDVCCTFHLV